ncbi:MAG: hypothetical protein QNJ63_17165 [Calothrix sp. MO_192.B10]|nr:hypothetical protein [Calothrix sp. MO_192.B10]
MEEQNNEIKKQNNVIIPPGIDEIESLNDSDELDLENLDEIAGGCCTGKIDCVGKAPELQ